MKVNKESIRTNGVRKKYNITFRSTTPSSEKKKKRKSTKTKARRHRITIFLMTQKEKGVLSTEYQNDRVP